MIKHLTATLGLDKTGFDAGMAAAGKQVNKFGDDLKRSLAGAFSIAAITAFTRNLIQTVSNIEDLSKKLGVSAETLQELEYSAKLTGSSIDSVATAFRALSKARLESLQDPNSKAGQVFAAMGISNADLQAQSLEQVFKRIAETVRTTDFGASEIAMVGELLGRSGDELIPMFKAGLEDSAREARDLGLIIEDGIVNAIDEAGDSVDRLGQKLKTTVAPAVKFIADKLRDTYDFADILVGNVGAIAGTLLGGGSLKEAREAGREHVFSVLDRREKEDAKRQAELESRKQGGQPEAARQAKQFEFAAKKVEAEKERIKKDSVAQIPETALGRIGAFTGAAANASLPPGQQTQIQQLQKIYDAMVGKGIIVRDAR